MNSNMQACIAYLFKMADETIAGLAEFIPCKVHGHNMIFLAQNRVQFLLTSVCAKSTAHDANQVGLYAKIAHAGFYAVDNRFNDTRDRQVVFHRHVVR